MTFEEILDQAIAMLQRRGRVSYRALQRQFQLDDVYLQDLTAEIIEVLQLAVDQDNTMLVWTGGSSVPAPVSPLLSRTSLPDIQEPHLPPRGSAPDVQRAPEAERRQLTVMFCDLVDSTKLSSQFDPEDWRDVVRAYQRMCTDVIQRFDGHVAQLLGDGLLVYFGYPQAHEDDAQRAVRTGLGILAAMGELNQGLQQTKGIQLAFRLGVHTGLVVVGELGGAGRQEQLALGEVPNIASRIEGLAEPNTVAVSEATYRLIQGYFACQDLGAHALRGVPESMFIYRVLGESGVYSRLDVAQPRGLTPLVGRESEVMLLLERWEQVKAGQGHVVLLTGDAGIGKSRLVHMLKEHVTHEPHVHWECRSVEYSQNSVLYPIIDLFLRLLRFEAHETPDEKVGKLEYALSQYRLPLKEFVPLFAPLLSLPIPEDRYPPLNLSSQRQRQKTLESLVAILVELAEQQPVLFIVEDLHWTDPTTLELLNLIIEQTPTASLLVLLTCRPHFQPAWHHHSYITDMTLNHLSHAQVAQIVTGMTHGKTFPAEVLQQIAAKTDGVPLFVEEMTKAILESGQLNAVDGHYELTGSLSTLTIPATLQDSLMARLDRLVTAKAVAQYAAVIGRQFPYELLQAVSQVDEVMLQHELGRLVEAEIVFQRGVPPQATYIFKHALIQDTAYQSLLRSTRQQYHQRIAQVLEQWFPETAEMQPEVVAQHYTTAGGHAQALPYWQQAGQRALARSAYREAVASFEQALSALQHLPEQYNTRELAIDLRLALRSALQPAGDQGRVLAVLREAEALAERLPDQQRLGQVLNFLSNHFYNIGVYDQAIAVAQRSLALAAVGGEGLLHALAHRDLGIAYLAQGDYRQAIHCLGQSAAFFTGARRSERCGQVILPAVRSRAYLSWGQAECGLFAEALTSGEEGLRIAEVVTHPASLMEACGGLGLVCLRQGNLAGALPVLERAVSLCQDAHLAAWFPRMAATLGAAYALAGRLADALPLLTQALEQTQATDLIVHQTRCGLALGEAQLLAGHLGEAHTLAEQALAHAQAHQERGNEAYALCLLGEIAVHRASPDVAEATAYYRQALALAEALGMRPLQAHCQRGLGMLCATIGQREQARTELATAIQMYTSMDMTFWLPQTEAALTQVEE